MEERKIAFIEAYIVNGNNATDAALVAGYSKGGAAQQGYRMLKDPEIMSILRQRQDALANKYQLNTESVIAELSKIVHSDPRKLFNSDGTLKPLADWPDDMAGAVGSFEIIETKIGDDIAAQTKKVKFWDKNSAIEKAMKHLGMFERDNEQNKPEPDDISLLETARRLAFVLRAGIEQSKG